MRALHSAQTLGKGTHKQALIARFSPRGRASQQGTQQERAGEML